MQVTAETKYKLLCDNCGKKITRSNAQNRYWWKCMSILANELGYTPDQMSLLVKDYFKWYEEFVNKRTGEVFKVYQSSADWNKQKFSENTEHLLRFGDEQGIHLLTPEEYFNN